MAFNSKDDLPPRAPFTIRRLSVVLCTVKTYPVVHGPATRLGRSASIYHESIGVACGTTVVKRVAATVCTRRSAIR